jgi:hypothetical protein
MRKSCLLALCFLLPALANQATAQGTKFNYQGRLTSGTNVLSGIYDLTFSVYDAEGGGTQLGQTLTNSGLLISNGLITASLDFGAGVFTGPARWLAIGVRTNGTGDFTTLSGRQPITPTPYAIHSGSASVAPWSGLTGIPGGFADGIDHDTTYFPGTGLNLNANTFSVDTNYFDSRYWPRGGAAPGTVSNLTSLNVKTYGAVGDGVTLDSEAIQALLYRGATNDIELYFPRGTYLVWGPPGSVTALRVIGTNHVVFRGESGATLKTGHPSGGDANMAQVVVTNGTFEVHGMTLNGNYRGRANAVNTPFESETLNFKGGTRHIVRDCVLVDAPAEGIDIDDGEVLIENCVVVSNRGTGIHLGGFARVINCDIGWNAETRSLSITNSGLYFSAGGMDNQKQGYAFISNCRFSSNYNANLHQAGGGVFLVDNCKFVQRPNATNIWLQGTGARIINCDLFSYGLGGKALYASTNFQAAGGLSANFWRFSGNLVVGSIEVNTSRYWQITGNDFYVPVGLPSIIVKDTAGGSGLISKNVHRGTSGAIRLEGPNCKQVLVDGEIPFEVSGPIVGVYGGASSNTIQNIVTDAGSANLQFYVFSGPRNNWVNNTVNGTFTIFDQFQRLRGNDIGRLEFNGASAVSNAIYFTCAADVTYSSVTAAEQTWRFDCGVISTNNP